MDRMLAAIFVLGLFFNGLSVRAQGIGPESLHDKFKDYLKVTAKPRSILTPAFSVALHMAHPPDRYPAAWRTGSEAYARNYGDHLARFGALQTGRFVTGALLHEDFRYRPSTGRNLAARALHALRSTIIDQSDAGNPRLALANFAGAAGSGFVPNLYLPHGYNNLAYAERRTAITFGSFAANNLIREFKPDLLKGARRLRQAHPRIPFSDWLMR